MKTTSFFKIYDLGLKRKRWNCTTLSDAMRDDGFNISPRSLQRYRTQEMRPNLNIAKEILKVLEIEMTDDEIAKSLEEAREERIRNPQNVNFIERGVRIPYAGCSKELIGNDKIKMAIDARIAETQDKKNPNLNKYLTDLICYDVDHHILPLYNKKEEDE